MNDQLSVLKLVTARLDAARIPYMKDSRSELQLGDVRQLITAQPSLDWSYLDRWAATLAVTELLRESRS